MTKKKITILTGAGFTASSDFAGITTRSLTNGLRTLPILNVSLGGLKPGEYIYRKLCQHYGLEVKTSSIRTDVVNFETIIHFLEELYAFQASRHSFDFCDESDRIRSYPFKGIKPAFLELSAVVEADFKKASEDFGNGSTTYPLVSMIYRYFINHITHRLEEFNSNTSNAGMVLFFDEFLTKRLPESDYIRRIYTLNYDDWLAKYRNFFDGFNGNGTLHGTQVLSDANCDCHYNLHGCIYWDNFIEADRVRKLTKVVDYTNQVQSGDTGLNREPLIPTPIISGYNKLQRMKYSPFLHFYYAFQRDVLESDLILTIGYGFGDTHVNNLLSLSDKKIVSCNYFGAPASAGKPPITPFTEDIYQFRNELENIFQVEFSDDYSFLKKDWGESKNGRVRLWWKGVGKDFYSAWSRIIA